VTSKNGIMAASCQEIYAMLYKLKHSMVSEKRGKKTARGKM
jgi:hypothetical protein